MAHQLGTLAVLAEKQGLDSNTHIGQFTTDGNSQFSESNTLFWLLWVATNTGMYTYNQNK